MLAVVDPRKSIVKDRSGCHKKEVNSMATAASPRGGMSDAHAFPYSHHSLKKIKQTHSQNLHGEHGKQRQFRPVMAGEKERRVGVKTGRAVIDVSHVGVATFVVLTGDSFDRSDGGRSEQCPPF
jgi:hypothetical protein